MGTGLERKVAEDSGALVARAPRGRGRVACRGEHDRRSGTTATADDGASRLHRAAGNSTSTSLTKFKRSNQDTCLNQRPLVHEGQRVKARRRSSPTARPPARASWRSAATCSCAFMPWGGYNFEDAILVSERLIKNDIFTSIHIEEFELQVRDTKRGVEEITREIPNVGEEAVKNLDEEGIIRIGARVAAGRHPGRQGHAQGRDRAHAPRSGCSRAIFGDKAGDVRDASLKAPPGMDGVVIDIKVFSRREKDESDQEAGEEEDRDASAAQSRKEQAAHHRGARPTSSREILDGQTGERAAHARLDRASRSSAPGRKLLRAVPREDRLRRHRLGLADDRGRPQDQRAASGARWKRRAAAISRLEKELEKEIEKVTRGDELPPGVVKLVKVYVAKKRKLSVGDKMAGRHGNKGVVAKILPEEDMPYLPDGTPGRDGPEPARRAVAHEHRPDPRDPPRLGRARSSASRAATPVFAGATVDEIKAVLREAGLPEDGKTVLYDGRTGEPFDHRVTVGYIYMMKLSPPGGRQDPRALHRPLLARHAAAAGRQGPVRRPALRRDGGVGARGLRRRLHAAGAAHRQVATTCRAGRGSTRRSSRARTRPSRACPSRSTCS